MSNEPYITMLEASARIDRGRDTLFAWCRRLGIRPYHMPAMLKCTIERRTLNSFKQAMERPWLTDELKKQVEETV